jgi:hypothetical protein
MSQIKLHSTKEGTWIKLPKIYPTEEQKQVLMTKASNLKADAKANALLLENKQSILSSIAEANAVSELDLSIAINAYSLNKPSILELDEFELIATQVIIEDGVLSSGFINYKLNGTINKINF